MDRARRGGKRKPHAKRDGVVAIGFGFDRAAVEIDDVAHQTQASAKFCALGTLARIPLALPAEQVRQGAGINAGAAVVHRELRSPFCAGPQPHFDGAAIGREMNGAVEEADQRLTDSDAVGQQRPGQRFDLDIEGHIFSVRLLDGVQRLVHKLLAVDRRELQLEIPRQQPPGVDHLIDELELISCLSDDRFAGLHAAVFGQRFAFDELGPSDDAVQRTAQIVGDDAQIVVGEPVDIHGVARGRAAFAIGCFRHQFMLPLAKSGERRRRGGASRAVGAPAMRGTGEGRSGKESGWCI